MTAIPEELFNRDGAIYMGAQRDPAGCQVGLFGVPYDGTTSFRPGTRFGPAAIRQVSDGLETYDPQLDADLDDIAFSDLGAVEISFGAPEPVVEAVKQATTAVLNLGLKPLMLGGEHSISSGAVAAVAERYPDLVLLQLDAHADLRESWLGGRHSHACAMRRCLEVLPSGELLQLAIRSGTKEEFQELRREQRLVGLQQLAERLQSIQGRPLYLTVDLDWFDPSVMPGTGTPEPGGYLLAIGRFHALMLMVAPVRQLRRLRGPVVAAQISGQVGMQRHPAQTAPGGIRCRLAVATTAAARPSRHPPV